MDRFDTMLAFTRVVELSSFTKASISLNLPKATVSSQVLALEKRLRVKLLNRTTRHVSVTADGAAYYERAIRLLSELDETEAAISNASTTPKGRLRVDVPAIPRRSGRIRWRSCSGRARSRATETCATSRRWRR